MPTPLLETLSPFGRAAVKLDQEFSELNRLSGQIQKLNMESDSALEHAVNILNQFAKHGQRIAEEIAQFSNSLQNARAASEAAARLVAERAQVVQERKQRQTQLREKLSELQAQVQAANARLGAFKSNGKHASAKDDQIPLKTELERINPLMTSFVESARVIKEEAATLKFKGVERDADAILNTLQAASRKIKNVL